MSADLMKWLKGSLPLASLYFVVGEESFFIRKIKKYLFKRVFPEGEVADFNYEDFDASNGSVDSLRLAVETFPIMADRRLVFCHSSQNFSEKDWEILAPVIEKPVSSTVLVFFFDKVDRRKKHFKVLVTKGRELPAKSLREWEVDPWVDFMAEREGLKLSSSTRQLFRQLVGLDLLEMENEIQKLKSYMGQRSQVEDTDILAVISRTRVDSIFTFTDAVGRKDVVCSLDSLARLLENHQNVLGVLVLVARHIRILSRIQEGQKKGMGRSQLIASAGVPPYFMNNYLSQAGLWTEVQITRTMEAIYETEKMLKSSPLSAHIWLENFVLQVCHPEIQ